MFSRVLFYTYFVLGIFFVEIFLVNHLPWDTNFFFVPSRNDALMTHIAVAEKFPSGRRKTAPEIRKNIQHLHKATMEVLKLYLAVFHWEYLNGGLEMFSLFLLELFGFILIIDSRARIRVYSLRLYSDPERYQKKWKLLIS